MDAFDNVLVIVADGDVYDGMTICENPPLHRRDSNETRNNFFH